MNFYLVVLVMCYKLLLEIFSSSPWKDIQLNYLSLCRRNVKNQRDSYCIRYFKYFITRCLVWQKNLRMGIGLVFSLVFSEQSRAHFQHFRIWVSFFFPNVFSFQGWCHFLFGWVIHFVFQVSRCVLVMFPAVWSHWWWHFRQLWLSLNTDYWKLLQKV